jgi:hypothetical protein
MYLPDVNGPVFVVAPVEEDGARKDDQQRTKQQQHLHGAFAAVHKVSVEHIRVFRTRQPILQHTQAREMKFIAFSTGERRFDAFDFLAHSRDNRALSQPYLNFIAKRRATCMHLRLPQSSIKRFSALPWADSGAQRDDANWSQVPLTLRSCLNF